MPAACSRATSPRLRKSDQRQSLAPYRSKEWEIGFKTDAHPLAISAALFRIQRPFAETVAFNATRNIRPLQRVPPPPASIA